MWMNEIRSGKSEPPKNSRPMNPRIVDLARAVNRLSSADFEELQVQVFRSRQSVKRVPQAVPTEGVGNGLELLTQRENEVLILVASGYSRKEIGSALSISENTAACHIASIYRKLDIRTIAEATHIAIRSGVIAPV